MTDHDAQLDAMTKQLVAAALLETFTDEDGDEAMRLTPDGEKVARQLALGADPLVIAWQGRQLRVRHDDARMTPYSPQAARIRSAVELASDVVGLRLVLVSALGERYRVRVSEDGSAVGLWRR
jgi:hypothetical protein